ncbi:hypothetical protein FA95DRAFT_1470549, partial [Auriscalpium vulgare]
GMSNLVNNAKECNVKRGIPASLDTTDSITYSPAAHRAVILLRFATSQCLFSAVADKYYVIEVNMLHPGTPIPAPTTVLDNIKALH